MSKAHNFPARAAVIAFAVILSVVVSILVEDNFLSEQAMSLARPLIFITSLFLIFTWCLWSRVKENLFGEIGFVYLSIAFAYTALTSYTIYRAGFSLPVLYKDLIQSVFVPTPEDFGLHLWRHSLFFAGVAAGYLVVRMKEEPSVLTVESADRGEDWGLISIAFLVVCSIWTAALLSAPVDNYHAHYTRFDHLSWLGKRFVYVCLILKTGGYFIIMTLLFNRYSKYKHLLYMFVVVICAYEIFYSFGARIAALTIMMAFYALYHYKVRPMGIIKSLLFVIILVVLFSGIEKIRMLDIEKFIQEIEVSLMDEQVVESDEQVIPVASEFGAAYFTSFHLYAVRSNQQMPPRDWKMFVYEFVNLIPFINHTEHHPQYWYARHYAPDAAVPPYTMGVIANSAIWGGEIDLLIRSFVNGAVFAFLMNWFLRNRQKWWVLMIYVYAFATCIMTFKYSVFYQITPIVTFLLPCILLANAIFYLLRRSDRLHTR